MSQTQPEQPRPRGRPRGFDEAAALEAALRVFWACGYDQASVAQLCRAAGMPRASLYQIYGGKEGLFLAALDRYAATRLALVAAALGPRGSLAEDLRAFFEAVVTLAAGGADPPGCLISGVLADAAMTHPGLRAERDRRLGVLETLLERRFAIAGDPADPAIRAALAAAAARGLVLRARTGWDAARLRPVAAAAPASFAACPVPADA
ncbi:TetR/AcrR family transcriptional regulator [Mangrovicoccus algicola]|uniref:TetR/AcrR family transcriptional regulator n=1 Tax=Mangrovicoccus algicola TaxID=2771008 RepID=A0A8J6YPX9_9RHOB|nr:TetR/AcrR family transcriptional regulator [Mangrovicoccus algicola]MBE3637323.1 TetR/AcrR family transcriptional regulator [Mangrovicoccus algicola]